MNWAQEGDATDLLAAQLLLLWHCLGAGRRADGFMCACACVRVTRGPWGHCMRTVRNAAGPVPYNHAFPPSDFRRVNSWHTPVRREGGGKAVLALDNRHPAPQQLGLPHTHIRRQASRHPQHAARAATPPKPCAPALSPPPPLRIVPTSSPCLGLARTARLGAAKGSVAPQRRQCALISRSCIRASSAR